MLEHKDKTLLVSDPRFIGVKIKDRSTKQLRFLASSGEFCKLLASMIKEIQDNEIEKLGLGSVIPNTLDMTEKLEKEKRVQLARFKYTIEHLPEAAQAELERLMAIRKKEKENSGKSVDSSK